MYQQQALATPMYTDPSGHVLSSLSNGPTYYSGQKSFRHILNFGASQTQRVDPETTATPMAGTCPGVVFPRSRETCCNFLSFGALVFCDRTLPWTSILSWTGLSRCSRVCGLQSSLMTMKERLNTSPSSFPQNRSP